MNKLVRILALGAMISLGSTAGAITTDGNWSDWFTYGGNTANNTWNENLVTLNNVNFRTQNDEEGPTPGGGGQNYDIEQIFYYYEDFQVGGGILHIGLVTGFPAVGMASDGLYAGDMFIDFGNTGGYDLAIAVSRRAGTDLAEFGNAYLNPGVHPWTTNPSPFIQSAPYRAMRNVAINATADFTPTVAWGGEGRHNFLEIAINITDASGLEDALLNPLHGGVGLHWTMQCGNDVIDVRDNTPFAPIPEPSTMALLGMGMLGVALRKKFTA